ncbi:response regulator transcription factor [Parvularcula sp. LCG005]|uniref:response regulator transcription factor n=1 Tax=Parvularcula sp. LCG005 TaxID=3078805 RepID=UPI0029435A27|nr:response regulator transcription factor [Parvularcula sp. LCG005]WOI53217.1 response regulator transcription factor [Parvularcula sp. LCG005]
MPPLARVLLVDHDPVAATALGEQFSQQDEFSLLAIDDIAALDDTLDRELVDLILLRTAMPGGSGIEACAALRQRGIRVPIILIGQASGAHLANDVLAKPFRYQLLVARMRAHLRSHEQSEDALIIIGPYAFQPGAKTLQPGEGETIRLTDKEAAILKFLHRAGGQPVPRDTLLDEVWGYNSGVTTHTLETHIYRLRQKIEPRAGEATLLLTDQGGYRLASEV